METLIKTTVPHVTRYVAFDIETAPMAAEILEPQVPEFDPAEVKVGNIKDPALIAAKVEAARTKHKEQFLSEAALSPLTGQVAAIGFYSWSAGQVESPDQVESLVVDKTPVAPENEALVIRSLWKTWEYLTNRGRTIWVGHNVYEFDLPFLVIRSRLLNIPVPADLVRVYGGNKYGFSARIVDTRNLFCLGRNPRDLKTSLGHISSLMGIGSKSGSGADFAALVNKNHTAARAYLEQDIKLTAKVAVRLGIEQIHGLGSENEY